MKVTSWLARLAIATLALAVLGAGQLVSNAHNAQIVADGGGPVRTTGG
jgi:hypothetical protein